MKRQLLLAIGVVLILMAVGVGVISLKPEDEVTVHFMQGVEPQEIQGTVKKQDKYLLIKPKNEDRELMFAWDKVKDISEKESRIAKKFTDAYDVIDFFAKFGTLAAAGVFFIGLYQYEQGQQWKRAEFFAATIKDISSFPRSENAKLMIDGIKLYPGGREVKLFPDKKECAEQYVRIGKPKILESLKTIGLVDPDPTIVAIRDCFDSFFSQLERLDQYIETGLVSKESVDTYMNYYIDLLSGRDEQFAESDRWHLLEYARFYKFPRVRALLKKYNGFKDSVDPRSDNKDLIASIDPPPVSEGEPKQAKK